MAINPLPFIASIPDPGQAFLQSFNAARQQRAQQDQMLAQQQAQQARQQQYAQWVQRLRTDRSPQAMSEFMLQFPEQAEAIKKAFEPIQEAEKQGQIGFYGSVLSALDRGDKAFAKQQAEQMLAAAKNTTGKEQFAKELEYGIELLDSNPDALRDSLASTVFTLDPERYKALYAKDDMTGFQKDLRAAGIDPNSEEGLAKARQFAELKTDPIVQMPTPTGGQFIGKQSEYYRLFGDGAPPPKVKQPPKVGEVRNGFAFTGGDPGDKNNWVKAKPLQNTKPPEIGANGMPSSISRAQYDAIVEAKGKTETDAWMLRNNVRLLGQ